MGKIVGMLLVLSGAAGGLYNWICIQKERQKLLEEVITFLQKSIFAMESEKIRVIEYFAKYVSQDSLLEKSLHEIAKRLATYTYPSGQLVWEEVLKEEEVNYAFDKEIFEIILHAGAGFFGRSREENICFLKRSIQELELAKVKMNEKNAQKRKVWVPVTMLGTVMLLIVFV